MNFVKCFRKVEIHCIDTMTLEHQAEYSVTMIEQLGEAGALFTKAMLRGVEEFVFLQVRNERGPDNFLEYFREN